MSATLSFVVLHRLRDVDPVRYAALSDALSSLLNQQWPRSTTARAQSFAALCDQLPVFLLLVESDSDRVVAACKLSRVGSASLPLTIDSNANASVPRNVDDCVLLENVIVDRAKRRGGIGRRLMDEMERFAAQCGFGAVCLVTNDQVQFYTRCGYHALPDGVTYAPVSSSASKLEATQLTLLLAAMGGGGGASVTDAAVANGGNDDDDDDEDEKDTATDIVSTAPPLAGPMPPPPPPPGRKANVEAKAPTETWMAKRHLSSQHQHNT
jgi:GNAT superfamily N-acetyltransferase